jgi:hypothetical protein
VVESIIFALFEHVSLIQWIKYLLFTYLMCDIYQLVLRKRKQYKLVYPRFRVMPVNGRGVR